ncbi:MAG: GNAT family N-acetyltransferase [Chloroflexia bacterium]
MADTPLIREARPEDAPRIIAYIQGLTEEPDVDLIFEPGEFDISVEDEEKFIRAHAETDNCLMLVGEVGGEIIAVMTCTGGKRKAARHAVGLGISIHKDWRDQGLGHRLMQRAVDWARGTGVVKRVELEVFARNGRAIHLYEKFGFESEGRLRRAFLKNGEYIDTLVMALLLP